ncbi:DUF262 domain-containing protein [Nitrosospira briensis]|uniref:DUF262 domain-containing protein n=1 Tax=Nitrosospira briensis TaxID=35799 RepID=UPI000468EDFF|nr:DUF262 domain-containing protein [Nitrosospira briensis]
MALTAKQISLIQAQLESKRKTVSFDSYDLSVRQVLEMVGTGDIFVPPEYQRQFIWDTERQSVLIESVFLGIPVPSLFMATNLDSTWEVVDGVQRLGSLSHFFGNPELLEKIKREEPLKLKGLDKLDSFNGVTFQELPKSIQLHFSTRPVRITVLNDRSNLAVRFDLFERLNTGGVSLTPQEIRNCVYRGVFNENIKKMASRKDFRSVVKVHDTKGLNGTYEELVLRFFAYLNNYQNFDHSVKDFLNIYMNDNRHSGISAADSELFDRTINLLKAAFPKGISRGRAVTPVNLYEAFAVGVALALRQGKAVDVEKLPPLIEDKTLKSFTGAGSNQKRFVIGRIEYVRDAL